MLTDPQSLTAALQRIQAGEWLPQELQHQRTSLQKASQALTKQIERLTEAYLAGIVAIDEYKRRRQELETRQHEVHGRAHELDMQAERDEDIAVVTANIDAFCQRVQHGLTTVPFAQKRRLVELLIDRVVVKGEEVEIRYVIPTSLHGETTRFCHLRLNYF